MSVYEIIALNAAISSTQLVASDTFTYWYVARFYLMVFVEFADPFSPSEHAPGFAVLRIGSEIGFDGDIQAFEPDFEGLALPVACFLRRAYGVRRKEVKVAGDVEVVVSQVTRGDADQSFAIGYRAAQRTKPPC
ncbi:MAG: hypothetical protein HY287_12590 [Planctomycetes bacterium]|nr:hypothetical protein [Planctomycetota bacterium]